MSKRKKKKTQDIFFVQFVKLLCLVFIVMLVVVLLKKGNETPEYTRATTEPTFTATTSNTTSASPQSSTTQTTTQTTPTTYVTAKTTQTTKTTTKATTQTTTQATTQTTYEPGYISRIPSDSEMESLITDMLLDINKYSRPANKYLDKGVSRQKITTIVVHYVANPGTSAVSNRNYFNNLPKNEKISAGAHYIVGLEGEIIRCIPDNEIAYHAGKADVNACSIGIEVCHPDDSGRFNYKTYLSLLKLVSWLCDKYDLSSDDVIRHYDVTGKACPKYYITYESEWKLFKKRLVFR